MEGTQFNDCYVEATLVVKSMEMFIDGKLVFVKHPKKVAVLHVKQANNMAKLDRIRRLMWKDLVEENRFDVSDDVNLKTMCNFILKEIPRMSKPITYNI